MLLLSDSQTLLTSSDRKMNDQQANCRELASSFVKALSASRKGERRKGIQGIHYTNLKLEIGSIMEVRQH